VLLFIVYWLSYRFTSKLTICYRSYPIRIKTCNSLYGVGFLSFQGLWTHRYNSQVPVKHRDFRQNTVLGYYLSEASLMVYLPWSNVLQYYLFPVFLWINNHSDAFFTPISSDSFNVSSFDFILSIFGVFVDSTFMVYLQLSNVIKIFKYLFYYFSHKIKKYL